jgi:hypothetical protein
MAARLLLRVFHFDDVVTWARRSSGLVVGVVIHGGRMRGALSARQICPLVLCRA